MTYGLGILLDSGLVMASDSRSNAGIDQITTVNKMTVYERPGARIFAVLAAGNLATTQAVTQTLWQAWQTGSPDDVDQAATMFDATQIIGNILRRVMERESPYVGQYGDPSASFLVGGQISDDRHRLFQIYSAGNFVEATNRGPFLQIGETKYGKPILDRALRSDLPLEEASKIALLSFDATMRSNLSVAPPIDLMRYPTGSLACGHLDQFGADDDYFKTLSQGYSQGLTELLQLLPNLPTPP